MYILTFALLETIQNCNPLLSDLNPARIVGRG